ncbi:MAG: DUF1109 domain-containing protein [Hyphomonadaceae bacterium]|nr:DUF1109 domain-containing protein [Hyphomonadaceae bacterium]
MQTDQLIDQLSQGLRPVLRHALAARLGIALTLGAAAAFAFLLATLGVRPDFGAASATAPFWMKWAFTLGVACASFLIVRRLGQPDVGIGWRWLGLITPFAVGLMMGIGELMLAPPEQRGALVLGRTAPICSVAIVGLAVPVFAGLIWAFGRLAPTKPVVAGAMAGVLASSLAASVYAFTCPEQTVAFMITWYTLGMAACAVAGAFAGKRWLQW